MVVNNAGVGHVGAVEDLKGYQDYGHRGWDRAMRATYGDIVSGPESTSAEPPDALS